MIGKIILGICIGLILYGSIAIFWPLLVAGLGLAIVGLIVLAPTILLIVLAVKLFKKKKS